MPTYRFPTNDTYSKYDAKVNFTVTPSNSQPVSDLLRKLLDIQNQQAAEIQKKNDEIALTNKENARYGIEPKELLKVPNGLIPDNFTGTPKPGRAANTVGSSCELFLPAGIQIADNVSIGNVNLGTIVGAGLAAAQSSDPSEMISNALSKSGSSLDSFMKGFGGGGDSRVVDAAAVGLLKAVNNTAGAALSMASGVAVNPNTRAFFEGVRLRSFAFSFKLMPTSLDEVIAVKNIIKFFRTELYPEKIGGGGDAYSIGYAYPNLFDISFYYKTADKPLATKLLPSYLQSFSATYNTDGQVMFKGGEFTSVDINLSFVEAETLDREKIEGGY